MLEFIYTIPLKNILYLCNMFYRYTTTSFTYIHFDSKIRKNFVRAVTRIRQGFSCRFYETADNMYYLHWREKSGGVGAFSGRQNDLSAVMDKCMVGSNALISDYRWAVRGREQQMIEYFGGIGSPYVGNRINGISPYNPMEPVYRSSSFMYFGLPGF